MSADASRSAGRRAFLLVLALASALVLAGCRSASSGSAAAPTTGALAQILVRGELRVGVSADLPPLNMKDRGGEIVGLEIDLVRALAEAMGLELHFVERPFAELLPTLESGGVDLVISGLTMTPERNARVAFAGPYLVSGTSLVSRSEALASAQDPAALDSPAHRFAALEGSTSQRFVQTVLPRARLVATADYESAVAMLIAGEVDALVADQQICLLAVWRNPDAGLTASPTAFTVEPLGIALPANAPLLLNLVTNYLSTLETTGLLTRFKARWLNDGSWVAELP